MQGPYGKLWTEFFFPSYKLTIQTEQMRLIKYLLYGFVDYFSKRTKSFDVWTSDQELEVRTATNGLEIDQAQHTKSVSHIYIICSY